MIAIALSALDQCRNGTVDSFVGMNVTKGDAPEVVHLIFGNATVKRRDADGVGGVFPCTELFTGEPSAGTRSGTNVHLILVLVAILVVGLAQGMAM